LLLVALGLTGVGVFAAVWGLRRAIGIDYSAVYTGVSLVAAGMGLLGLWIWLGRRRPKHWVELDIEQKAIKLILDGVKVERSWNSCGRVFVQEIWRYKPGSATAWTRFDVWVEGFARPLFISSNHGDAEARALQFAGTCGLAFEAGSPESRRKELEEQQIQIGHVQKVELPKDEALLFQHLDPRIGAFDWGRETAIEVNLAVLAAFASAGTAAYEDRLKDFTRRSLGGHARLKKAGQEAVVKMSGR
jgi:hypothetical protein